MKKPTDSGCVKCKKGVCFRVEASRLEESLGHAIYQCDHCKQRFKVMPFGRVLRLGKPKAAS